MEYSIYVNREDVKKIEEEERDIFIRSVVEAIGIDLDDIWKEGEPLTPISKLAVWETLNTFEIDIIHDGDRGYKIYFEDQVVGEWFKPRAILREDNKARKLSKRFYYELKLKYSSLFEEHGEENE